MMRVIILLVELVDNQQRNRAISDQASSCRSNHVSRDMQASHLGANYGSRDIAFQLHVPKDFRTWVQGSMLHPLCTKTTNIAMPSATAPVIFPVDTAPSASLKSSLQSISGQFSSKSLLISHAPYAAAARWQSWQGHPTKVPQVSSDVAQASNPREATPVTIPLTTQVPQLIFFANVAPFLFNAGIQIVFQGLTSWRRGWRCRLVSLSQDPVERRRNNSKRQESFDSSIHSSFCCCW